MTNLTPNPRATGQKDLQTYAEQRDRPLRSSTPRKLFPGPGAGCRSCEEPLRRAALALHSPHMDPSIVGPGRAAAAGEEAGRGGSRLAPGPAARPHPAGSEPERARTPPVVPAGGWEWGWGWGTPRCQTPSKVYFAAALCLPGELPGARSPRVSWPLRPPAGPLQAPAPSLRTPRRGSVSPRRPGAPAPRSPIGPGIQAPPPDSPASPHPGSSPLHAGVVASRLSFPWFGQPGEGAILHPESVQAPPGECEERSVLASLDLRRRL